MRVFNKAKILVKRLLIKLIFRIKNKHNRVSINTSCWDSINVHKIIIGVRSYGKINVEFYKTGNEALTIGSFCSLAPNVTFICGGNHNYNLISTYPFKAFLYKNIFESYTNGPIIVDDDVWIGYGATIMSGVHIGQGAVVAAGAVVTKDVPPYAIVGGVPAKVINYRFTSEFIEALLKIDYSKLTKEQIQSHINDLYEPLKDKSQLDWMEKKEEE